MKFKKYQLPFVVLAVFLMKPVTGSSKCPYGCKCNKTSILCIERDLGEIPKFSSIRPLINFMDFSNNDIDYLDENSFIFSGITQIKVLKLNGNSLTEIESSCFINMINLEVLDLHDNLIGSVSKNIIKNNKNLILLNLSENLFIKKAPIIESESLEVLDLSFTRISAFNEENVNSLPNLRILHLHHNNLKYIDANIFLKHNYLFHIELAQNIWDCNCKTIELFEILINNNMTKINKVQCKFQGKFMDIYDEKGPIFQESTCSKKEFSTISDEVNNLNNYTAISDYLVCNDFFCNSVNVAIMLTVTIISIIVLFGIILMTILFKKRKYEKVTTSYEMQFTSC